MWFDNSRENEYKDGEFLIGSFRDKVINVGSIRSSKMLMDSSVR
jgi:hypothetical protein